MIFKNLFRRKTRTLLTTFGIAVGVAAVVALGALAEGFISAYGALGSGSGADLMVSQRDAVDIIFSIIEGESLAAARPTHGGQPLLMGRAAATDLGKQVGDSFRIYETTYRIVGIYETGQPFEDGAAVISLEDAQALSGKPRQVNAFLLQVRDVDDLDDLRAHRGAV